MHTEIMKSRGGKQLKETDRERQRQSRADQPRESAPRGVSQLLDNLRLPASVKDHLKHSEVWTRWIEIVGPELSRVTSPLELKSKTLIVTVVHQAWAQQLHFLKASLLAKIRVVCEDAQISDIYFRVGKVAQPESILPELKPTRKKQPLSERQEMTLRAVEDEELRASIRRAMEAWGQRSE